MACGVRRCGWTASGHGFDRARSFAARIRPRRSRWRMPIRGFSSGAVTVGADEGFDQAARRGRRAAEGCLGRHDQACVVNGRLRYTGKNASRHAPPCVVSRVVFCVLHTSSACHQCRAPNAPCRNPDQPGRQSARKPASARAPRCARSAPVRPDPAATSGARDRVTTGPIGPFRAERRRTKAPIAGSRSLGPDRTSRGISVVRSRRLGATPSPFGRPPNTGGSVTPERPSARLTPRKGEGIHG